jgi:hypothetical protein
LSDDHHRRKLFSLCLTKKKFCAMFEL